MMLCATSHEQMYVYFGWPRNLSREDFENFQV
jgi:hypothetical protein